MCIVIIASDACIDFKASEKTNYDEKKRKCLLGAFWWGGGGTESASAKERERERITYLHFGGVDNDKGIIQHMGYVQNFSEGDGHRVLGAECPKANKVREDEQLAVPIQQTVPQYRFVF